MICDAHVHTWRFPDHYDVDVVRGTLPPKRRDMGEEEMKRIFDLPIEKYIEESAGSGVEFAVLLGADAHNEIGLETTNDYLASVVRKHPRRFACACCVNPTLGAEAADEVQRCAHEGAVAVGELTPSMTGYRFDDPRCDPVWEASAALGMPIVVHAGPSEGPNVDLRLGDLTAVDVVARKFPKLKIVICHMGYPYFDEAIHLLGKHRNVFADVSQLQALAGIDRRTLKAGVPVVENPFFNWVYPISGYFSKIFGSPDKLIWGTDFPAGRPSTCIAAIRDFNKYAERFGFPPVPQVHLDRILEDNWRNVFSRIRLDDDRPNDEQPQPLV
ncbi:amidohydrolase 2 [Delftia sp. Cs1-4]|uniref:amidohydrolase family protein n=1 Tax=Delftia sp. (strain Cs1-4) TaxID=742013 RepID=UPI00020E797C|nr:amidohydrolase family protein [Delftia sp. Cs1-4]AEF88676.1 amidohydrolase 2 [Delftia sp. Cs1-4]